MFQPARYCLEYPLSSYLLVLRSKWSGKFINLSLDVNETEIVLDPQDGLEDNQKYVYTITAINSVGTATTDENTICNLLSINRPMHTCTCTCTLLDSTDVQSVNATVVGESTIDIQCWFIHGSDALGCKVVLVSEYKDEAVIIIERNNSITSASGTFNLTHQNSCYSRVLAFDIEHNKTISNLSIEGNLQPRVTLNTLCSGICSCY